MLIDGIFGGTASAKTALVRQIIAELQKKEVCFGSQDSDDGYTSHLSDDNWVNVNFNYPNSIDLYIMKSYLKVYRNKVLLEQPVYSISDFNQASELINRFPKKESSLEGFSNISNSLFRETIDISKNVLAESD